jgi:hypothetical protein
MKRFADFSHYEAFRLRISPVLSPAGWRLRNQSPRGLTMGRRNDLIAKYASDLRDKCGVAPDMDLLTKVTIACGPSIYNADAETVAATQPSELETVKNSFLIRKLGLADGPKLEEAIQDAIETYGRSERNKYRPVIYYLLTKAFGKEAVFS